MDVHALAQQRQMLAYMGIDLWVAKDQSHLKTVENVLYRDSVVDQHHSSIAINLPNLQQVVEYRDLNAKHVINEPEKIVPSPNVVKEKLETSFESEQVLVIEDEQLVVEAFELQAVVFAQHILVLDSTQLTAEQQTLLSNIQASQSGQSYQLKWPFALVHLQDGRGVSAYVAGFLAALQQEQSIVALGQLPITLSKQLLIMPSLQEMLDEPLLKRKLWHVMQGN